MRPSVRFPFTSSTFARNSCNSCGVSKSARLSVARNDALSDTWWFPSESYECWFLKDHHVFVFDLGPGYHDAELISVISLSEKALHSLSFHFTQVKSMVGKPSYHCLAIPCRFVIANVLPITSSQLQLCSSIEERRRTTNMERWNRFLSFKPHSVHDLFILSSIFSIRLIISTSVELVEVDVRRPTGPTDIRVLARTFESSCRCLVSPRLIIFLWSWRSITKWLISRAKFSSRCMTPAARTSHRWSLITSRLRG